MKVNTVSETTVLESLPYYTIVAHEGQHWKWNHCPWMLPLLYDSCSWRSILEVKSLYWMPPLQYDRDSWKSTLEVKSLYLNASPPIWQRLLKVNTVSEIIVLDCLPYYMIVAHEGQHRKWNCFTWMPPYYMTEIHDGQHWKWNHCTWMPPLLYDRDSWRSTLEVKSLYLNASPTIWQRLMKVNTGSEITVLQCLPYYMTETHEGQHWKWNNCTSMPPLLYDRGSWRSTPEVKLLYLSASPTIWQRLMKVNTGSEITVLECLPYYMTETHEGQHWKWNHWPWIPPLLYDNGSWRSTLEVKSQHLNATPTIWQRLIKVNTRSEITVLECLPYYVTETHERQHWKWNHCPWFPTLLYDSGSWRSTQEVKSLNLYAYPTIWQRLMTVNTGSEINVLECLFYYMTETHEGQNWKWNHCPWMPPLLYDTGSWKSALEVKSLSLNASPTVWYLLMKVNIASEISELECLPYYMTETHEGHIWKWNHSIWMPPLLYDRNSWRSTLEVKSLSLNASPTIW